MSYSNEDPLQILTAEIKSTFFSNPAITEKDIYTSLISAAELEKIIMFCSDNDQIENGDWQPMIEAVNRVKANKQSVATIFQGGINYNLLTNLFKEFIIYYKKYISETCGVFLLFHGNENVVFKLDPKNDKRMIKKTTIIYNKSEESTKYRSNVESKILRQFENYYCYTITGHEGNAFKFLFCSPYPSDLFKYFSRVKTYIPLYDICFFILYLHEIDRKKTKKIEKDDVMFMQTYVIKAIICMTKEARLFFPPNNMINNYDRTRDAYRPKKKLGGGSINFLFFAVMLIIIILFFFSYCLKKVNMRLSRRNTSPYKTIDL